MFNRDVQATKVLGFTLIELITALVLLVVLLAIAIPSFSPIIKRSELSTVSVNIRRALNIARSEAVKRQVTVYICARDSLQQECAGNALVGRKTWNYGLVVFADNNKNKKFDKSQDNILYEYYFPELIRVGWNRGDLLAYAPSGWLKFSNGTFLIESLDADMGQKLILSKLGRVRAEKITP